MSRTRISDLARHLLIGCGAGFIGIVAGTLLVVALPSLAAWFPAAFVPVMNRLVDVLAAVRVSDVLFTSAYLFLWWGVGFLAGFLVSVSRKAR